MKMHLMIRSLPSATQTVIDKHAEFKSRLPRPVPIIGISRSKIPAAKEPTTAPMSVVSLTKALPARAKGSLNYRNRKYFEDKAQYDDWLSIEFPVTDPFDSELLAYLPTLVSAFSAYVLKLGPVDLISDSFDRWRKWARTHNSRYEVFRVFPVAYYSASLCKSAFKLTPKKVCSRLAGHVASCQEVAGGVYVIGSHDLMSVTQAHRYDKLVRSLLISER